MPKKKAAAKEKTVHGKYTIPEGLNRRLRVEAAKRGVTSPEIIRELLEKHLPRI